MLRIAMLMFFNDTRKYVGIVLSLAFTSFMMAMQPGTFVGLLAGMTVQIDQASDIDLWVMKEEVKSVDGAKPMTDAFLYRVRGVQGVEIAAPYYKGNANLLMSNGEKQSTSLVGIDEHSMLGGPKTLHHGDLNALRRHNSIYIDWSSVKPGGVLSMPSVGYGRELQLGDTVRLQEANAVVAGFHKESKDADPVPTILVGYGSLRSFINDDRTLSYILVKLKPGANAADVASRIRSATGLKALSPVEFSRLTYNYLLWETGNYVSFGIVTLISFVIGASIAAQSFAAFSRDNLKYFGLFKAIGTPHSLLLTMILLQALIAACLGFGVGIGCVVAAGFFLKDVFETGFSLTLPLWLVAFSACSVVLVVAFSSALSIRRVLKLEPSVVFRT
jgi:putative ABC transport system permease protein